MLVCPLQHGRLGLPPSSRLSLKMVLSIYMSQLLLLSDRSVPAVRTGEQGTETPGGREGGREPSPPFLSISSGAPCCLSSHIPHPFTLPSLLLSHLPSGCLPPHHTLPPLVALAFLLLCPLSFLSSPCRNRATCQDGPQGPRCLCPPGYTGGSCQVRGTEPGVLRREGQESSSKRASGIKRWQQGSLGEVST